MHLMPILYLSFSHQMSYEERMEFAHDVVGPTLYKHSDHSYYSESEYTLDSEAWKQRYISE